MNRKKLALQYIILDYLSAALAWAAFFAYRKVCVEQTDFNFYQPIQPDQKFYFGILFIPFAWVLFYAFTGYYYNSYRKSRLKDLGQTALTSVIGVLVIFFILLLDDAITSYKSYYHTFITLLGLHFSFTVLFRLKLTTIV